MLIIILEVGQIERSLTTNFGSRWQLMKQSSATADGIIVGEEFTGGTGCGRGSSRPRAGAGKITEASGTGLARVLAHPQGQDLCISFNCCVTSYHKPRSLKQHTLIICFLGAGGQAGVPCSVCHKTAIKVSARPGVSWEAQGLLPMELQSPLLMALGHDPQLSTIWPFIPSRPTAERLLSLCL